MVDPGRGPGCEQKRVDKKYSESVVETAIGPGGCFASEQKCKSRMFVETVER